MTLTANLIARIYEVDPLICSKCGGRIKILGFVTHKAEIHRIFKRLGWPIQSHDFDAPYDLPNYDICQLVPNTVDGFPLMEIQIHCDIGPDPPSQESDSDPLSWGDNRDAPHPDDNSDPPHWSD